MQDYHETNYIIPAFMDGEFTHKIQNRTIIRLEVPSEKHIISVQKKASRQRR
jgi:hypothetical protein